MDEEEEIDIVGNFDGFMSKNETDISNISSGQLLSCDYTVHPKWLNENADGGNYWSDSVPKNEDLEDNVEVLQSEEVVIEEPEPVPSINDLEWAGEITTHDDLIFEDDIPATIEEIVADQDAEFEVTNVTSSDCISVDPKQSSPVSDKTIELEEYNSWEPAAFETHPPVKNIEYIGPTNSRSLLKVKLNSPPFSVQPNPRSLLKRNFTNNSIGRPPSKFKQTLTVNQSLLKANQKLSMDFVTPIIPKIISKSKMESKPQNTEIKAISKFKQTVKFSSRDLQNDKFKMFTKKLKKARSSSSSSSSSTTVSGAKKGYGKGKRPKKQQSYFGENITISHETDKTSVGTVSLGTVVKLNRSNSDSDIEVDVETDMPYTAISIYEYDKPQEIIKTLHITEPKMKISKEIRSIPQSPTVTSNENQKTIFYQNLSKNFNEKLVSQLKSLEVPKDEHTIDLTHISDLEKVIHSEFFDNRPTKTPEQYLRIRNHIIGMWKTLKPTYISKTAVRSGLKHGGDVNCISRIHRLLEQIGVINFGYQGKYFDFVRPLENFMSMFVQTPRNRSNSQSNLVNVTSQVERRQRIRTNTISTLPKEYSNQDSNYTISHMDGIARPQPPVLNTVKYHKSRSNLRVVKTELDLVTCLKFSKDNIAPFKVSITLSTLLCLHLHSLSSNYEVMGFLGGHRSKSVGRCKLSLTRYKPCRTSQQSGTMCEMCPVSQVEQASSLGAEGFELLGWFHSHPLFPANPSITDVRTQKEMQIQFSFANDRPFIGLILSCLNMAFKCMYVMPKDLHSDFHDNNRLPYEIGVDIIKDCTNLKNDIRDVLLVVESNNYFNSTHELIQKFKASSDSILKQFGYKNETFFLDVL